MCIQGKISSYSLNEIDVNRKMDTYSKPVSHVLPRGRACQHACGGSQNKGGEANMGWHWSSV